MATLLSPAKGTAAVLDAAEECLRADGRELAFSLAYVFDADEKHARRGVRSAIDGTHVGAPELIPLAAGNGPWPLRELLADGEARLVPLDPQESWPPSTLGKASSHALVLPIVAQVGERPVGAFIAGLNPSRPVDEGTRSFLRLLVGQVGAALANARAFEEEKRHALALAELDRAKTTFFSNVSHEFRTPLTLMLAPIDDLLASPTRDPDERHQLALLHRNALRLLKLVNTLLEFSRLEAGRVEATYEPTDLAG